MVKLWENFLMIERLEADQRHCRLVDSCFRQTYDQKKMDLVEESGGNLFGYKFIFDNGKIR